jgi:hypothetical protein
MTYIPQDATSPDSAAKNAPVADAAEQATMSMKGLGGLVERVGPWLFEVGNWICGGLTAFGLVAISALLTVGPVDRAVLVSTTAFACSLPLNVSAIFLLRMVKDITKIRVDELALQSFREAGFPNIEAHFLASAERKSRSQRMSKLALVYGVGAASFGAGLTLVGLVSALWHMAWWLGVVLLAMVIFCLGASLSVFVVSHSFRHESEAHK